MSPSWASLMTQLVKKSPAMQDTWVQSLGWEGLLEKEMATYSNILPRKIRGQRSLVGYSPWDHRRVGHDLATKQQQIALHFLLEQNTIS